MKLSEAIRKGAAVTKPGRRAMTYVVGSDLAACALGAAVVGLELEKRGIEEIRDDTLWRRDMAMRVNDLFPELKEPNTLMFGKPGDSLTNILVDLNDDFTDYDKNEEFAVISLDIVMPPGTTDIRLWIADRLEFVGL